MDRANGSPLILPTQPLAVVLRRAMPSGATVEIPFHAIADPRAVEQQVVGVNALLLNELLIGLSQAQATLVAQDRMIAALMVVLEAEMGEGEAHEQLRTAREQVRVIAARCTIATPAASALDGIAPS